MPEIAPRFVSVVRVVMLRMPVPTVIVGNDQPLTMMISAPLHLMWMLSVSLGMMLLRILPCLVLLTVLFLALSLWPTLVYSPKIATCQRLRLLGNAMCKNTCPLMIPVTGPDRVAANPLVFLVPMCYLVSLLPPS